MIVVVRLKKILRAAIVLIIFSVCFTFDATPVSADTIAVNITYDENEDNSDCSLREALYAAWYATPYNGCASGSPGADEIILGADTYSVESQLPTITDVVIISGVGSSETIVQASSCNPTQEACSNDYELFNVPWTGTLTLSNLTVENGKHILDEGRGVIYSEGTINIFNCVFTTNRGAYGGVIKNVNGNIYISNSTFSSNMAQDSVEFLYGGVIYNSTSGIVNIERSTFTENSALIGGAILNAGVLEIVNSTFSGNDASNKGGGIFNTGSLTITNCTFSENSAPNGGAGIYNDSEGTLDFTNTLIANSTSGTDCVSEVDIGINLNNLVEDEGCGAKYTGDPLLGPLADNGGPTQTHALLNNSTGIDNGHLVSCPETDQRGVDRPQQSGCDIGSFEQEPYINTYIPLFIR